MYKNPIKICFVIDALEIGGTEKQLVELISNLDHTKFKLYLVCLKNSQTYQDINSNCAKLLLNVDGLSFISFLKEVLPLRTFLRKEGIDIVQTFFIDANILGVIAAELAGVKTIISSRRDMGFWYNTKSLIYLKVINKFVDRFLVNSEAIKENVVKNEKISNDKVDVIYNGVNLRYFGKTDIEIPRKIKKELGIPVDDIVVGFIANLNRRVKRPDVFIKASAIVSQASKNASFLIVGDGHLRDELDELARTLNVHDKIIFAGQRKNVASLLKVIDIGVLTSDSEGFPNAILEYMATGIPTVATDTGGNRELIDHNRDGYLQPIGEPGLIAESILKLINNEKLRKHLGNKAKEKVHHKFSLENMIKNTEDYYSRVCLS
jgi:glycosyltransferase involved in cell wall biosynthesis